MDELAGLFGRLHPLVLHLPIGMIVALALLEVATLRAQLGVPRRAVSLLVVVTALSALAAAGTGWVLGNSGDYGGDVLERHRNLGIAVAAGSVLFALLHVASRDGERPWLRRLYHIALLVTAALLVPAGHLGATLTHGADFLLGRQSEPRESTPPAAAPDEQGTAAPVALTPPRSTFDERIAPIFAARCSACHGETKRKGKLALHDVASIEKGGSLGAVLVPGQPQESEMVYRLRLPLEHDEHMPPEGKPQVSEGEIQLIEAWITAGAPFEGTLELGLPEVLPPEAAPETAGEEVGAALPEPSAPGPDPAAVAALERELVHVERLDPASGGLWVDFAAVAASTDDILAARLLGPLEGHVTHLGLARTGVGMQTLELCGRMPRLRRLDLRATSVGDAELAALAGHATLAELVLARTAVSDASLDLLLGLPALERVFLWGAVVSTNGLERLRSERPALAVDAGLAPDAAALEVEPELSFSGDRPLPGAEPGATDALAPVNTVCPVSGSPVDPRYRVVHDGRVIGFCCPECPKTFWADPEACLANLR